MAMPIKGDTHRIELMDRGSISGKMARNILVRLRAVFVMAEASGGNPAPARNTMMVSTPLIRRRDTANTTENLGTAIRACIRMILEMGKAR